MQERTCFIRTAASFSLNLPRDRISSNSSPPLQILDASDKNESLLGNKIVAFGIFKELVHLHDVGVVLCSELEAIKTARSPLEKVNLQSLLGC